MGKTIADLVKSGVESGRFIVYAGNEGTRFTAFDYSLMDGVPSIIGIDPLNVQPDASQDGNLFAKQTSEALNKHCPEAKTVIIESELMPDQGDTCVLSLALTKKMHSDKEALEQIHMQNVRGELPLHDLDATEHDKFGYIKAKDSDVYLPPSMMKHALMPQRIDRYVAQNPDAAKTPVNKKGETLKERLNRYTTPRHLGGQMRDASMSSQHKRKSELRKLKDKDN